MNSKLTDIFILGAVGLIFLYDIVAVMWCGGSCTISNELLKWAHVFPAIPFAFGVLIGHLFFSQRGE